MFRNPLQTGSDKNDEGQDMGRCPVCGNDAVLAKPDWFPSETCAKCEGLLKSLGWDLKYNKNFVSPRSVTPGAIASQYPRSRTIARSH